MFLSRTIHTVYVVLLAICPSKSNTTPLIRQSEPVTEPIRFPAQLTSDGASIEHSPSFSSFSFEPAFWVEFFGNATAPNQLTFELLSRITERGGRPIIRPGGITMDSMIFDPQGSDPMRVQNPDGGIYRTVVGPAYYQSWSNFPSNLTFVSTLNFGNDSLDIARDLALASVLYQSQRIRYFELGNEPTNYPSQRWGNDTEAYVRQWDNWTAEIDLAIDNMTSTSDTPFDVARWWASSATTDDSGLNVRPADIIPLDVDSRGQIAEYSIHSYAFATCDPARAALATIPNILNHSSLLEYAHNEIYPSGRAALESGTPWIIGEFNSIACSGAPGVSDTFAQALWTLDVELIYATLNASSVHLHQGATLVFQSSNQVNSASDDGSPGYSTYDMLYPRDSTKRGRARSLPSFPSLLFMAEAFSEPDTRVRALDTPPGVDSEGFASYAFYLDDQLVKLALINMMPFYANSTDDHMLSFNVSDLASQDRREGVRVKRLTAPSVDETDTSKVLWAGQSFENGTSSGDLDVETVDSMSGVLHVRGSEAVLVFLGGTSVYGT